MDGDTHTHTPLEVGYPGVSPEVPLSPFQPIASEYIPSLAGQGGMQQHTGEEDQ